MFTATIFMLTVFGPKEFQDSNGPYSTEIECEERIEATKVFLLDTLGPSGVISIEGVCIPDDSQAI